MSFPLLRNLTFLSKPAPKRVFLSKDTLSKIKELHLGEDYILVKRKESYFAFSRRCPHLGCKLNYDPEREWIICPCHKSKFTLLGKYLEGPAKKDLKILKVEVKEEGLFLELS